MTDKDYNAETMRILKQCAELKRMSEELDKEMREIENNRLIRDAEIIANYGAD